MAGNYVAKVLEFLLAKSALACFKEKVMLFNNLHCLLNMSKVAMPRGAVYQYIVKENKDKFPEIGTEDRVHDGLECRWCIA